jgi:hypothetical protein
MKTTQKVRAQSRARLIIPKAFFGAFALAGCSAGDLGDTGTSRDESLSTAQEAAQTPMLSTWTPWRMPLALCIQRGQTDPNESGYYDPVTFETVAQNTLDLIARTWGLVPGMSFFRSCSPAEKMTLKLFSDSGGGGCSVGVGAVCEIRPTDNDWQVVHEIGHGLGMHHEHQRSEFVACPGHQALIDAWNRCTAAYDATPKQPCTAADVNFIFNPDPNVSVPTIITAEQRAKIEEVRTANLPDPNAAKLTVYDPQSVMSYCGIEFGGSEKPTNFDLLGMEMLYPLNTGHKLRCKKGCFNTPSGVVVRTDGIVTSGWFARGAIRVPMSLTTATSASPSTISATSLPSGTASVSFTLLDPRGNRRTGSGTSLKSNAVHAAIAASTRVVL